jgi:hypothetical protein
MRDHELRIAERARAQKDDGGKDLRFHGGTLASRACFRNCFALPP